MNESDLKKIQEICNAKASHCFGCIFANDFGICLLNNFPYKWKIDFILDKLND